MSRSIRVRTNAEIVEIERGGLDAFLPAPTPYQLLERGAATRGDATALHFLRQVGAPERDVTVSYADLLKQVRQAANLYRRLGIGTGDAVALLLPNIPQGNVALWAAEVAGRACPVNPMLQHDHLVALLRAAGAKVAVVLGKNGEIDFWDRVLPALREAGIDCVLDVDAEDASPGSDGAFEALLEAEPGDQLVFEPQRDPDGIAAYFHTGGTTGAPKLAIHTRRNQAFVAEGAALMYDLRLDDVLVNGFPLFHVAGTMVYGLSVLAAGGTVLMPTRLGMRNRDFVAAIWRHVEQYRITALGGVPTVLAALNQIPVGADIGSLRVMLTGGSPLPPELADAFERHTRKPVRNILGMTECAGVVTIEPFHGHRTAGSTGLRLPFTEVRAFTAAGAGADLSRPCPPGATGIIALRGPNVAPGYTDAAMNRGTFEGGWLVSGDLGHVDAEGRVFITGRAKDVIIRGAHNIDPATIEEALLRHPSVAIAAAVGQPDGYAGELPVAFVVLKSGARLDAETLLRFAEPLVSEPAALPKRIWILPELPLTPIGKIYKPALRAIATRHAVGEALSRAGVTEHEIAMHEASLTITAPQAQADAVRRALTGMPIRYDVNSRTR